MNELKPCPFCSSDKVEVVLYNTPCVVCRNCNAGGPAQMRLTLDNRAQAESYARLAWNQMRQSDYETSMARAEAVQLKYTIRELTEQRDILQARLENALSALAEVCKP